MAEAIADHTNTEHTPVQRTLDTILRDYVGPFQEFGEPIGLADAIVTRQARRRARLLRRITTQSWSQV